MKEIIDLIENGEMSEVFEQLDQLDLLKGDLLQLEREYTSNVSRTDVNFSDRLKTAVRKANRKKKL
jgi:hypothetical protein